MDAKKRIVVNTAAQYTKAVINTLLSLYTVRLVLSIIGESDYGIMSIIMGIVGFLGFITNALVVTTQRHLSYDYGNKDDVGVRRTFSNCFSLHLIIGVALIVVFLAIEPLIINDTVLNIADNRWRATHFIYRVVTLILFTTFITAPFKAVLIARENIVFISAIEVLDGILKVAMVLCLPYVQFDKLETYSVMMLCIFLFELTVYTIYDLTHFKECSPHHFFGDTNRQQLRQLVGFAGWTTYGMGAIVGRNQGVAWLFNFFYGTVLNAAYGVANQIFTAVTFISSSVSNAMNPQIMKSEGAGDRTHMLHMAEAECKIIVCTTTIVFIPIMMEINGILSWWLTKVPAYTSFLAISLLTAFLIDQFTTGLNAANQAIGRIRNYQLMTYTPKLFIIPIGFLLLHYDYGIKSVMYCFITIEALVALSRLPYLHYTAGLSIRHYARYVLRGCLALIIFATVCAWLFTLTSTSRYRFFFTIPICCLLSTTFAWFVCLTSSERQQLKATILKKHKS
ncbi:MAG: MATE family efflux transporter [Prevotella sp.]|nr:MATE family efflux transporter [Prevotella sp.]